MSNDYINGVIVHSRSKRSARAVLVAIANRAGTDGHVWQSHAAIACEAGVSERTVTRAIAMLVELGEIEVLDAERRHSSPQYRILLQPEKSAKRRHVVYAKPDSSIDNVSSRVDNVSSSIDKLSEPTYTRDLNPIEPNKNPEGVRAPATLLARKVVSHKSPHLTPTHFVDGYIPAGQGVNAVEVYYERFSINQDIARLNALKEDDLIRQCPDLDRLRAVVTEYSQTTYKPGNVRLILDWYRDGPPSQRQTSASTAFGLQRQNGNHHAISSNVPTDEEQPDYDSEFGKRIRESNRRMAEEYAAKQAARRGVSLPHL